MAEKNILMKIKNADGTWDEIYPITHAENVKDAEGNSITSTISAHENTSASTSVSGHVQLNDTTTSTSTSQAATANSVKTVNDTITTHTTDAVQHITAAERSTWNAKLGAGDVASSATKLATARTITLSGDVTGSVSFDGSTNASMTATVVNDSHNHTISTVTGLQTALDGKASTATASSVANGLMSSVDKVKLDAMPEGGTSYTHPDTHPASIIAQDTTNRFVTDAEKTAWNAKLDATANAVSASKLATARTISLTGDVTGSVSFDGSANASITAVVGDNTHDHQIANVTGLQTALDGKAGTSVATTSVNGLMAATDKTKLDGITVGANNYTHPATHPPSIIAQDTSNRFVTDVEKASWNAKADTSYVDTKVAAIVDTAPEALNTLNELAAALGDDPNFATSITTQIGSKAEASALTAHAGTDASTSVSGHVQLNNTLTSTSTTQAATASTVKTVNDSLTSHAGDTVKHITSDERTIWNAKAEASHNHNINEMRHKVVDITIDGDANTYYPVVIDNISTYGEDYQPTRKRFELFRGYSWTAPNTWYSDTHKGSLQLYFDSYVYGWGGARYYMDITFAQEYSKMVADITIPEPDTDLVIVWLRGGTARYRLIAEDADITITPYIGDFIHKPGTEYERTYSPKTSIATAIDFIGGPKRFTTISESFIGTGSYRSISDQKKITTQDYVDGVISTHGHSISNITGLQTALDGKASNVIASTMANGLMSSTDKTKLDGVATGANNYSHPATHPPTIIVQDSSNRFVTDAEKTTWNAKLDASAGAVSAAKLTTARTISLTGDVTGSVSFDGSANASITTIVGDDSHAHTISTVTGLQTALDGKAGTSVATTLANGLMASADKTKLDGITAGANNYTHPATHPPSIIAQDTSNRFVTDVEKASWNAKLDATANAVSASKLATARTISLTGDVTGSVSFDGSGNAAITATVVDDSHAHIISNVDGLQTALDGKASTAVATTLADGLMASADKTKLDGISAGANNYVHPETHAPSVIVQDLNNRFVTDAEKTAWNAKLDATANAVSASKLATARTISLTGDVTGSVSFDGSGNASITTTVVDDSHAHIIANVDGLQTALDGKASTSVATTLANGLMSSTDKTKLDGVATGANNYTHPANHPASIITQDASNRFVTDAEKAAWTAKADTTYVDSAVAGIVNAAPATLDTLNELATALGNDPNFATTITTQIGTKADASALTTHTGTAASTTVSGHVQLNNTTSSTSTTQAATANIVKTVNDSLTTHSADAVKHITSAERTAWNAKLDASSGAVSAAKLTTARTISLTGDVTGSVSFDGSTNASITTAVADDSHAHTISTVTGLQTALDGKAGTAVATTIANGLMASADKTKLDSITAGANNYTHPATHPPSIISQDTSNRFVTDAEKTAWNAKLDASAGAVSAAKLTTARTISLTGDVTGSVSFDGSANASITTAVADDSHAHTISTVTGLQTALDGKAGTAVATTSVNGLMASTDKTKLDGIATGANNYTHPANHPASVITQDASNRFVTDAEKTAWNAKLDATANAVSASKLATARTISLTGDVTGSVSFDGSANASITATVADDSHAHTISTVTGLQTALDGKASTAVATTSVNGLMSSTDKTKLDAINQAVATTSTVQFAKIGVGTSSPNEPIDIAGNVRIRQTNALKFGGVGASDSKASINYNETTKSLDFIFA